MIGIIIALKDEKKYLIKKIKNKKYIFKKKNIKIISGKLSNKQIIIVESGIGKTLSSISSLILINKYKPKLIINIGAAGSLKKNINNLDIVLAQKTQYHDIDLRCFKYKLGELPNTPRYFIINKNKYKKIKNIFNEKNIKYKEGLIITGDQFINNKKKIIKEFPKAISLDMECASIAHVCNIYKNPFISIKIISDELNNNAKIDFKKNINKISKKIYFLLKNIIFNL